MVSDHIANNIKVNPFVLMSHWISHFPYTSCDVGLESPPERHICDFPVFKFYHSLCLFCGALRFSEEIPNEENEINNDSLSKSSAEAKPEGSPPLVHKKTVPNSAIPSTGNHDTAIAVSDKKLCSVFTRV